MTSPSTGIEFHIHRTLSDIPLDEAMWNSLVDNAGVGGVFLKYSWIRNWWHHFGHAYRLFFVTAQDADRVLAFAPMMLDEANTLRFIGDSNADYLGFVIPHPGLELLRQLIEFLGSQKPCWNAIHLRNIPRSSLETDRFLKLWRGASLYPWNNYSVEAPFLAITGHDDQVSTLLQKESFRRSERLLRSQGTLRFEVFTDNDRAEEFWKIFSDQHRERCRHAGRPSNFSDPAYLPFLKSLFESDKARKHVHFCALFLDDRPIAFHFGFVSQNRLLWYKPSFDVRVVRGSPGITLTCHLIQCARRSGLGELDFTIGDEPFKSRFCEQSRMVDEFRIHKSRARYLRDSGGTRLRRTIKTMLKPG